MTYSPSAGTAPRSCWSTGIGGAGTVRLALHDSATDARLELLRGWRVAVGPDRLAPAVLEAFRAAALARLQDWASDPATTDALRAAGSDVAPQPVEAGLRTPTRETVAELGRAWRDLREFGLRLASLLQTPRTVSAGGRVTVSALGGQIVDLALDPVWRRTATDPDLAHEITATLRAALQQCAALPAQALRGCPDLAAVLARHPVGSRFAPAADPRGDR